MTEHLILIDLFEIRFPVEVDLSLQFLECVCLTLNSNRKLNFPRILNKKIIYLNRKKEKKNQNQVKAARVTTTKR